MLVAGVLVLPLFGVQRAYPSWIAEIPLPSRLKDAGENLLFGFSGPVVLEWILTGVVLVIVVLLLTLRTEGRERRGAAIASSLAAVTVGLPVLAALGGQDFFLTRNVLLLTVTELRVEHGYGATNAKSHAHPPGTTVLG